MSRGGVMVLLKKPTTRYANPWSIDTRDYSVATLMDLGSDKMARILS